MVGLIDRDPQGSLTSWWNRRQAETPILIASPGRLSDTLDALRGLVSVQCSTTPRRASTRPSARYWSATHRCCQKPGLVRAIDAGEQIIDSKRAAADETANGWKYTFAGGRAGLILDLERPSRSTHWVLSSQIRSFTEHQRGLAGPAPERRPHVRPPFRGRPAACRVGLLEHGDVCIRHAVPRERLRPLLDWHHDGRAQKGFGRFAVDPDPKDRPSDTSNWLPAAAGPFNLTMRLYGPETSVLNGYTALLP